MPVTRRRRDEGGAVAVIVAISSVLLFVVAALAVDLGNGFARERWVQAQADFAALAGGAAAPAAPRAPGPVPPEVADAVRDYLNDNQPQDDKGITPVTSAQLTNGDLADGEVEYVSEGLTGGIRVVAPQAQVDFGFANVLGIEKIDVGAEATVGVYTPGNGVMPTYAVSGCDYGAQVITDPAGGHVEDPEVPPLAFDTDSNDNVLDSLTPGSITVGASGVQVTLEGDFRDATKVGFFRGDDPSATVVEQASFVSPNPLPPTGHSGNAPLTFVVPDEVAAAEAVWYVRVFQAGGLDMWSASDEAQPLRVGDAVLECVGGSSDGNFGTITVDRDDTGAEALDLPMNIAAGIQLEKISLAIHAGATAAGTCTNGVNGAIWSREPIPGLKHGTNCVDTDTGLPANDATQGLLEGVGSADGRLDAPTSAAPPGAPGSGCSPAHTQDRRRVQIGSTDYDINDDVLTCFVTDGTTSLAEIASPGYSGGPALSPAIYESPRFFWQPVLRVEPFSGGSNLYSIVDFRPAFITDEEVTGSAIRGSHTATPENGLTVENNGITEIKVVFFNADALSSDDTGQQVTPYLGVGPRILRITD